jgi:hypothetical protein
MAGTRRTPVNRSPLPTIMPRAIQLFEQMRRCSCTCPPIDWGGKYYGRQQCPGCKRWWSLQNDLCDELHTPVWAYPCVEDPRTQNPYPPFTNAYRSWEPNRNAQELWQALAEASREAKRQERAARKGAAAATQPPEAPPG